MTGLARARSPALRGDNPKGLGRRYDEPPADDEDKDRDASHDNPDGQTEGLSPTRTFDHPSTPSPRTVYHLSIRYLHPAGPPSRRGDALCAPTGLDVVVCAGLRALTTLTLVQVQDALDAYRAGDAERARAVRAGDDQGEDKRRLHACFSQSSHDIPSARLCVVPHTPYPSSLPSAAPRKGRTRRMTRSGAS